MEAFLAVTRSLPKEQVNEHVFPIVKALAQADWFTSHIAAAALLAAIYPQLNESAQEDVRG